MIGQAFMIGHSVLFTEESLIVTKGLPRVIQGCQSNFEFPNGHRTKYRLLDMSYTYLHTTSTAYQAISSFCRTCVQMMCSHAPYYLTPFLPINKIKLVFILSLRILLAYYMYTCTVEYRQSTPTRVTVPPPPIFCI